MTDLDFVDASSENENLFCHSIPTLPRAWDSTMLGLAKTCWRKFKYIIIDGYSPTGFAAHLAFGIAYHKALETFDKDKAKGATYDEALNNTIRFCLEYGWRDTSGVFHPYDAIYTSEPTKTRDTLVRAVVWYLDQFRDDPAETVILANGEPAVELSFKLNLTLDTPDGTPFVLCGHLDRLVDMDGHKYFTDRKTTKSQLTAYYWASFTPNNQMSLYYAASQLILNEPARGGIIDAAQLGVNFARFARHIIHRTSAQQEEWLRDTYHWLDLATRYAAEDYWPMNDTACVSGNAIVSYKRGKNKQKALLKDVVAMFKNPHWRSEGLPLEILVDKGGHAGYVKIKNAWHKGRRRVLRIETENNSIIVTGDHQIKTARGWIAAEHLTLSDEVLCWRSRREAIGKKPQLQHKRPMVTGLTYHPYGFWTGGEAFPYKGQRLYRLIYEAHLNNMSVEDFIHALKGNRELSESFEFLDPTYHIHHKDGNVQNNDISNLEPLESDTHSYEHVDERITKAKALHFEAVLSIAEEDTEQDVYDIEVDEKYHNFIADGIVVHNCSDFGGCPFRSICAKDPKVRQGFLEHEGFMKKQWNPLESR